MYQGHTMQHFCVAESVRLLEAYSYTAFLSFTFSNQGQNMTKGTNNLQKIEDLLRITEQL